MPYTIPAFSPGQNGEGYFYRPPFTPRYSIPQSFGEALSYEAQVHWLAGLCQDAERMLATMASVHCWRTTAEIDTSGFVWNQEFLVDGNLILAPENDWAKPGDIMLLRAPHTAGNVVTRYTTSDTDGHTGSFTYPAGDGGPEDLIVARVVKWAPACEKLALEWHYTVHDYSRYLNAIGSQLANDDLRITHNIAEIAALKTRVTNLETRMTNVENRVTSVENRVTNLEGDVTELKNRMTNVENRVIKLEGDVTDLTNRFNEYVQNTSADLDALWEAIRQILAHVAGGGSVDTTTGDVTWNQPGSIAIGNMNVYSSDTPPTSTSTAGYILTRTTLADNDIWAS